jgi:predicted dehydrogenase
MMIEKRPLKYGIIGCGMMGQEHVRNLKLLDAVELAHAFEPDEGMRMQMNQHVPSIQYHESLQALLRNVEVDAWIIASPNFRHAEQLGMIHDLQPKPTLVEKPLCTSPEQLKKLLEQRKSFSFPIWVAMEYRYMPPLADLLEEVRSPSCVGQLKTLSIREHRFPFLVKVDNWNRFNVNSGGTLVEKCCHFFDLMYLIAQSKATKVFASGGMEVNHLEESYLGNKPDIIDQAFVIVEFANGMKATLDLCMFAEGSLFQEEITAVGSAGKVECKIPGPNRFWPEDLGKPPVPKLVFSPRFPKGVTRKEIAVDPLLLAAGDHHGSTFYQHQRFQQVVLGSGKIEVGLEDGARAVLLGLAAQESIKTGQAISLQEGSYSFDECWEV